MRIILLTLLWTSALTASDPLKNRASRTAAAAQARGSSRSAAARPEMLGVCNDSACRDDWKVRRGQRSGIKSRELRERRRSAPRQLQVVEMLAYDMVRIGSNNEEYFLPTDIKTNSNFTIAYVVTDDALITIDIADLTAPTILDKHAGEDYIQADIYDDTYLVVSSETAGLQIFNVQDPLNVHLVSQIGTEFAFSTFHLYFPQVFLAADSGIVVVNIADPENPTIHVNSAHSDELSHVKALSRPWILGANTTGYIHIYEYNTEEQIVLNNTFSLCSSIVLIVITSDAQTGVISCKENVIFKLDFSELPTVNVVDSYSESEMVTDLVLSENQQYLYTAAETHIEEITLDTFKRTLTYNTIGATTELYMKDDFILAVELGEFTVIEIKRMDLENRTEPLHFVQYSTIDVVANSFLMTHDDRTAFAFASNTLMTYDTADLLNPTSIASYSLGDIVPTGAILSQNDAKLVLSHEAANTLELYHYTDSLSHAGTLTFPDEVLEPAFYNNDNLLAVAAGSMVYIIDVSNLSNPQQLAELNLNVTINCLAMCLDEYVVVGTSEGIKFLNITNLPSITVDGSVSDGKKAIEIIMFSDCSTLLTRNSEGMVLIYDVLKPTSLTLLTSKLVPNAVEMILSLSDDYLVTIDTKSTAKVFNVLPYMSGCVTVTSLNTGENLLQVQLLDSPYTAVRTPTQIIFFSSFIGDSIIPEVSASTLSEGKEFKIKFYPYNSETKAVSSSAKLLDISLMDSELRVHSPEYWMTIDAPNRQYLFLPPTANDLLDSYSIQVNFSLPIDTSAFDSIATESITSSDIETELIKLGYLGVNGYVTNNFDFYTELKLSKQFAELKQSLHTILLHYKSAVLYSFSTQEFLKLNTSPIVFKQIRDQIESQMKVGQSLDFQFDSDTFSDDDLDTLEYSTTYQTTLNGVRQNPQRISPSWLNFDPDTRRFYGTATTDWFLDGGETQTEQTQEMILTIRVTASDGYDSATDSFDLVFVNNIPTVNITLQDQFEAKFGTDPIRHGQELTFTFDGSTFSDRDNDQLYYNLEVDSGNGWEYPEDAGYLFDSSLRTLSGTASNPQSTDLSVVVKVTALDREDTNDAAEVEDHFTFVVSTAFPDPAADTINIQSSGESETIQISVGAGYKLYFPDAYNSALATDLAHDTAPQTNWKLEGSPADINSLLALGELHTDHARLLQDDWPITLVMNSGEVSYPASVFKEASTIQLVEEEKSDNAYIGEQYIFNLEDAVANEDQLILTYAVEIDRPSEASNWLQYEESLLRIVGVPEDSNDIGDYAITVKITDVFGDDETFELKLTVDYTEFDLFIMYLRLIGQIFGVLVAIVGFIKYYHPVQNILSVKSYRLHPLMPRFRRNQTIMYKLKLPILHHDENAVAKRLYKSITRNLTTWPTNEELNQLMNDVLDEWRDHLFNPTLKRILTSMAPLSPTTTTIKEKTELSLLEEGLVSIDGETYHLKYLFDYLRHRINKLFMTKQEWSTMKRNFKKVKQYCESEFDEVHRNTWCLSFPFNVLDFPRFEAPTPLDDVISQLQPSFELSQTELSQKMLCDMIVYEIWQSTAVWCDKNSIDNVVVSRNRKSDYRQSSRCIQKIKRCIESILNFLRLTERSLSVWTNEQWIRVDASDEEFIIKLYPEFGRIDRVLIMAVYSIKGVALAEAELSPPVFNKDLGIAFYDLVLQPNLPQED